MKFLKKLLGNRGKEKTVLYTSIKQLPIINWIDMRSSGDLKHLIKEDHGLSNVLLLETYYSLINEFWGYFGQDKSFKEVINKKLKLLKVKIKFIETGDRFLINEINVLEDELMLLIDEDIKEIDAKSAMLREFALINKEFNGGMSITKDTVFDFYTNRKGVISG